MVLLASLATWYLATVLQNEDFVGPFNLFEKIRLTVNKIGGNFKEGFYCFWCLSMWIAIPLALLVSESINEFIIKVLAIAAISVLVNLIKERFL